MNKERHVLRERDLLLSLKHFNIVRMYNTFKVSKYLIKINFHNRMIRIYILFLKMHLMDLQISSFNIAIKVKKAWVKNW